MAGIITAVLSLLGGFTQPLKDWIAYRQEAAKKEYDYKLALIDSQTKQTISSNENETARSAAWLNATGTYFKYFTFCMWFGPFFITYVKPSWSQDIFKAWETMPPGYFQSCMILMFTVWGIQVSSPMIASVFTSIGNYFVSRREYKLEKLKTINEGKLAEELRKNLFPNGFNQAVWDGILKSVKGSVQE